MKDSNPVLSFGISFKPFSSKQKYLSFFIFIDFLFVLFEPFSNWTLILDPEEHSLITHTNIHSRNKLGWAEPHSRFWSERSACARGTTNKGFFPLSFLGLHFSKKGCHKVPNFWMGNYRVTKKTAPLICMPFLVFFSYWGW